LRMYPDGFPGTVFALTGSGKIFFDYLLRI